MARKKITVGNDKELVGSETDYKNLLQRLNAQFLLDTEGFRTNGFDSLEDGRTYESGPPATRKRARPVRYIKGIDPESEVSLPREHLVFRILDLTRTKEFVLIKGPAGAGKSSLVNLTDYYCRTHKNKPGEEPTPITGYTFIEKDKPLLDSQKQATSNMEPAPEENPTRILFCDDVQNVEAKEWEKLVNQTFLKNEKLRIVGATTRRCASDPASPFLDSDALVSFNDLRLLPEEETAFLSQLLTEKDDFGKLDEESRDAVVNAVRDQCGRHVFALQVSMDKLDEYERDWSRTEMPKQ